VRLAVRVKPRAKRAGLLGWHGGALRIAVRAAPERGRANDEVRAVLARVLGVPTSALLVSTGATSPSKTIDIEGLSAPEVRQRIDFALGNVARPRSPSDHSSGKDGE
jgi:uncharacterized protein YggU (UPF0235/DUF167 family)